VTPAIAETVKRQVETGIDCIGNGEFWRARTLGHYTAHFTGIEARPRYYFAPVWSTIVLMARLGKPQFSSGRIPSGSSNPSPSSGESANSRSRLNRIQLPPTVSQANSEAVPFAKCGTRAECDRIVDTLGQTLASL
jgi:hypothetical protein